MKQLFLISIMFLAACEVRKKNMDAGLVEYDYGSYRINLGGCVTRDSLQLTGLGNGLLKDQNGKIYFHTEDRSDEGGKKVPVFILRFPNDCNDGDNSSYDLSQKVDPSTFYKLGDGYYRDKNNTYHFQSFADGGQFTLIYSGEITYTNAGKGFYRGSDGLLYIRTEALKKAPETFGDPFYRMVPDIDVSSYITLSGVVGYAKDKKHVYWITGTTDGKFIRIVNDADPASFSVLEPYTTGKDTNNVYEQGYIVIPDR